MYSFDLLKIAILLIVASESKYSNICILAFISQNKTQIYSKIFLYTALSSQKLVNKLKFKKYSKNVVTITWILYFNNKLIKHGISVFYRGSLRSVCVCACSHMHV